MYMFLIVTQLFEKKKTYKFNVIFYYIVQFLRYFFCFIIKIKNKGKNFYIIYINKCTKQYIFNKNSYFTSQYQNILKNINTASFCSCMKIILTILIEFVN